jgi:23S rRNA pseudouridine1911/1915/1917 synthase
MKRIKLRVGPTDRGQRLDKFLAARSGLSRGVCRRAITEGGVWIEGRRIRRLSLRVQLDRVIEIVIADVESPIGFDPLEPQILFEDSDLLAIDKPAGLPSQGTLASDQRSALAWAQRLRGEQVRTVHRLDIGTTGVLLLAKTAEAATALAHQFKNSAVEKRYLALCTGELPSGPQVSTGRIRPSARRGTFQVTANGGIPAETHFQVLARHPPLMLVEARPATGRTHQIRVHLAAAGAALFGDPRYGGPVSVSRDGKLFQASRPLLHAAELSLRHPFRHEPIAFRAKLPRDFIAAAEGFDLSAFDD